MARKWTRAKAERTRREQEKFSADIDGWTRVIREAASGDREYADRAKARACRHPRRLKVYEWNHQSMGPQADAFWCPDCGALRRNWERRWMRPGTPADGKGRP